MASSPLVQVGDVAVVDLGGDPDLVLPGDREQRQGAAFLGRPDEGAGEEIAVGDDAVIRRSDRGEVDDHPGGVEVGLGDPDPGLGLDEVRLGLLDRRGGAQDVGPGGEDRRLHRLLGRLRGLELLSGLVNELVLDRTGGGQADDPVELRVPIDPLGHRAADLRLGLMHLGLRRLPLRPGRLDHRPRLLDPGPRQRQRRLGLLDPLFLGRNVDPGDHVALLDDVPVVDRLGPEVSRDLRVNIGEFIRVDRGDLVDDPGDPSLSGLRHLDPSGMGPDLDRPRFVLVGPGLRSPMSGPVPSRGGGDPETDDDPGAGLRSSLSGLGCRPDRGLGLSLLRSMIARLQPRPRLGRVDRASRVGGGPGNGIVKDP